MAFLGRHGNAEWQLQGAVRYRGKEAQLGKEAWTPSTQPSAHCCPRLCKCRLGPERWSQLSTGWEAGFLHSQPKWRTGHLDRRAPREGQNSGAVLDHLQNVSVKEKAL